jgi:uncharacterized protein
MALQFEWNDKKSRLNKRKHRLTFEEASTIFGDPLSVTIPDTIHSVDEERFITIGNSIYNRLIVVVHTDKEDIIRIISARQATANEKRQYENE